MKKIYFLALSLTIGFSANAQLTDDFESYPLGSYFGGHWTNWSGSDIEDENIIIANDQASSGTQSGFVGGNGIQDPVLNFGNVTGSVWTTELKVYVDFGASGYFNFQDVVPIGAGSWGLQVHINDQENWPDNPDQIVIVANDAAVAFAAPFPFEEWVTLRFIQDVSANTAVVTLNGETIYDNAADLDGTLGGMDFYSISSNSSMYIDDIKLVEGEMGVFDVTGATISVYPTVVKDNVNISAKSNISDIAVFNTAGQQVMKTSPNSDTTQINMSSLPAGVYIVKIQAGKETLTKKVVVK